MRVVLSRVITEPGHVVNRYTGGGAVVVAHIQQKTQHIIPNASPVRLEYCFLSYNLIILR